MIFTSVHCSTVIASPVHIDELLKKSIIFYIFTLYKLYAVPVRVCSTREDMHYPWVISSVPVSHILSTREDMQYLWVISSVPVSHILSTREDMQYPWVNLYEWRMNETYLTGNAYPHGYCISSRVLRIWLTGTDDMTHGYCISSRVLRIWLTGTYDMTHG